MKTKGAELIDRVSEYVNGHEYCKNNTYLRDQLQGDRSALFRVNQCLFNFGKEVGTIQGGQRSLAEG